MPVSGVAARVPEQRREHETRPKPAWMTAPAPPVRLVPPASDAVASFMLPQAPAARIDVLVVEPGEDLATGLFRASIGRKVLFERVEVRCKARQYRWVGDGTSAKEALRYRDDMAFGAFAPWDVKYPYVQYLCGEGVVRP